MLIAGVETYCSGSRTLDSPSIKIRVTGGQSSGMANASVGSKPVTNQYAIPLLTLVQHPSYQPLTPPDLVADILNSPSKLAEVLDPKSTQHTHFAMCAQFASQGTSQWHKLRVGVITGSILAAILGFWEPKAAARLGMTPNQNRTLEAYAQVMPDLLGDALKEVVRDELTKVRLEWGSKHEVNGLVALLKYAHSSIPAEQSGCEVKFFERGLQLVHMDLLPEEMKAGVNVIHLTKIGSSVDGEIQFWRSGKMLGSVVCEVKAPPPFVQNTGGGGSQSLYAYRIPPPVTRVAANVYAQCQLHMAALGVPTCWLIIHGVEKSVIFQMALSIEWCNLMFKLLEQVTNAYITPKVKPSPNFGQKLKGYPAFLSLTIRLCMECTGFEVDSIKGAVTARFHA